jgi:hypothetical protein
MVRAVIRSMCALTVLTWIGVAPAAAQAVVSGTVKEVYPRAGVIVFDDGRQVQLTNSTVVLREQRPVGGLAAVRPGDSVTIVQQEAANASPSSVLQPPAMSPFGPSSEPQAP